MVDIQGPERPQLGIVGRIAAAMPASQKWNGRNEAGARGRRAEVGGRNSDRWE